jgi:hypothetical protein
MIIISITVCAVRTHRLHFCRYTCSPSLKPYITLMHMCVTSLCACQHVHLQSLTREMLTRAVVWMFCVSYGFFSSTAQIMTQVSFKRKQIQHAASVSGSAPFLLHPLQLIIPHKTIISCPPPHCFISSLRYLY